MVLVRRIVSKVKELCSELITLHTVIVVVVVVVVVVVEAL